jgi:hypothetical protein
VRRDSGDDLISRGPASPSLRKISAGAQKSTNDGLIRRVPRGRRRGLVLSESV